MGKVRYEVVISDGGVTREVGWYWSKKVPTVGLEFKARKGSNTVRVKAVEVISNSRMKRIKGVELPDQVSRRDRRDPYPRTIRYTSR